MGVLTDTTSHHDDCSIRELNLVKVLNRLCDVNTGVLSITKEHHQGVWRRFFFEAYDHSDFCNSTSHDRSRYIEGLPHLCTTGIAREFELIAEQI